MRFKTRPEPQTSHVRVSSAVIPCILAACEVADPFSPAPSLQTASRYLQLEQKRPIDQHLPASVLRFHELESANKEKQANAFLPLEALACIAAAIFKRRPLTLSCQRLPKGRWGPA